MKKRWNEDEFKRALQDAAASAVVRSTAGDLAARAQRRRRRASLAWSGVALASLAAFGLLFATLRPDRDPSVTLSLTDLGDAIEAPEQTSYDPDRPSAAPVPGKEPRAALGRAVSGSVASSISADGTIVAFSDDNPRLVRGDTNREADIFVRDLRTDETTRVSVSSSGVQADDISREPRISGNGRFVVFSSEATNLVEGDRNGDADVFLHDLETRKTLRVSLTSSGAEAGGPSDMPSISDDGTRLVFRSSAEDIVPGDSNKQPDVFLRDLSTGATTIVSRSRNGEADGPSRRPFIAGDGHFVAYSSAATNVVSGDTNGVSDIFVLELRTGAITRESVSEDGGQMAGASAWPSLSRNGRVVAFLAVGAGPTQCADDPGGPRPCRMTFVRDRVAAVTQLVTRAPDGSPGNGDALSVSVSPDGGFVALSSDATNLVQGDTNAHRDVFLYDRAAGSLQLLSVAADGRPAEADSGGPAVSTGARVVSFQSLASDLVRGDGDRVADVFIRNLESTATRLISTEI
jgi:Tol biopolymer transport system component